MIRQSSSKIEIQRQIVDSFVRSLPIDHHNRNQLLLQYQRKQGYQFLNPQSKFHGYFQRQLNDYSTSFKKNSKMEMEKTITMQGNVEQLSVGGMCQILKQRIRQGKNSYQPTTNQIYLQEITYTKDPNLQEKTKNILHQIRLLKLKDVAVDEKKLQGIQKYQKPNKMEEFRKQMTMGEDGSLGAWGGKKYEGLGSRNEFSQFRRQQSLSFYHNASERKKI